MTREDIMKLAKECGNWSGQTVEMNDVGLERFAALVAAAERQECIDLVAMYGGPVILEAAIRARGEQ